MTFARRTVPLPPASLQLRPLGSAQPGGLDEQWELMCRDGWDWQQSGPNQVLVRVAILSSDQAAIVQEWIERIKDPAVWWAVSRELHSPGGSSEVSDVLSAEPWLEQVFPVLLEASTEGAPPPPPDS
ncbi:MAG TPA: hypothetical protein VHS99_01415 [Chloroflexota bacterium]|nr:hypothetical protein [Chloroflexota bacterium]